MQFLKNYQIITLPTLFLAYSSPTTTGCPFLTSRYRYSASFSVILGSDFFFQLENCYAQWHFCDCSNSAVFYQRDLGVDCLGSLLSSWYSPNLRQSFLWYFFQPFCHKFQIFIFFLCNLSDCFHSRTYSFFASIFSEDLPEN